MPAKACQPFGGKGWEWLNLAENGWALDVVLLASNDRSPFLGRGCDEALISEKKGFSVKRGGGNSVNEGFGKDFCRKGNSVKRSGRLSRRTLKKWKVAVLIPFSKISSEMSWICLNWGEEKVISAKSSQPAGQGDIQVRRGETVSICHFAVSLVLQSFGGPQDSQIHPPPIALHK